MMGCILSPFPNSLRYCEGILSVFQGRIFNRYFICSLKILSGVVSMIIKMDFFKFIEEAICTNNHQGVYVQQQIAQIAKDTEELQNDLWA